MRKYLKKKIVTKDGNQHAAVTKRTYYTVGYMQKGNNNKNTIALFSYCYWKKNPHLPSTTVLARILPSAISQYHAVWYDTQQVYVKYEFKIFEHYFNVFWRGKNNCLNKNIGGITTIIKRKNVERNKIDIF